MQIRTDLAMERKEALHAGQLTGVASEEETKNGVHITRIHVLSHAGAKQLGRPVGDYITVDVPPFQDAAQLLDGRLDAVVQELRALLPAQGTVLAVGIGNMEITPDALGPKSAQLVLATRHIKKEVAASMGLGELRAVSGLSPGVLGQTGLETGEVIAGVVAAIKPSAVITIDALAARKLARLGSTVQLANTGITPGSGVGNSRMEISEKTLGVPVISIGVPTVVDAATLTYDLLCRQGAHTGMQEAALREQLGEQGAAMMVTPREIDLLIDRAAKLIAMAINCALQPHIPAEDLLTLVS